MSWCTASESDSEKRFIAEKVYTNKEFALVHKNKNIQGKRKYKYHKSGHNWYKTEIYNENVILKRKEFKMNECMNEWIECTRYWLWMFKCSVYAMWKCENNNYTKCALM